MIVRNDLGAVATVIDLPRRTRKVVVQNLAFASIVLVVLVGIDRFATLPLPLGVAGHETSTATKLDSDLASVEREALSAFIAYQMTRTPERRPAR